MIRWLVWYLVAAAIAIPSAMALRSALNIAIANVSAGNPYGAALRLAWVSGALLIGTLIAVGAAGGKK